MKLYGKFDGVYITDISCNLKAFKYMMMFIILLKKLYQCIIFMTPLKRI